ncbi:hypothetical protein AB0L40_17665 [Patulibacter sp. NPDC049589]|uniref:hypothetical protein n=1 Tax=Patulibacter sp. NPDC049589 TaxID=3154731 RepID=UPI00343F41B7
MPIDLAAAERFVLSTARLLDRHRLALLRGTASPGRVLEALRPYRNDDGGFGHALEPDVRGPGSEPTAALHALGVLHEAGLTADPMVDGIAGWVDAVAGEDGGVPFVGATTADFPHAPWMVPSDGGSHLTFALAAALATARPDAPWLARGTAWCWDRLERPDDLGAYLVKFALVFLDAVPDRDRAAETVGRLRPRIGADGTISVEGGTADERLSPLVLSPRPRTPSRTLFTDAQIERDLDGLEAAQQEDGGWTFDWLAWAPGQTTEWRGALTVDALRTLAAHGRVDL